MQEKSTLKTVSHGPLQGYVESSKGTFNAQSQEHVAEYVAETDTSPSRPSAGLFGFPVHPCSTCFFVGLGLRVSAAACVQLNQGAGDRLDSMRGLLCMYSLSA